jgi:hypothetical protein
MGRKRQYTLDENYFNKIDTKNKAYIVGFIYADGSITKNYLSFVISLKDIEILEFIKKEISYSGPLRIVNDNYISLSVSSYKITNDLKNIGIIENKTYLSKSLPIIDEKYLWNFMMGYFDGDGSIYKASDNNGDFTVNFSSNEDILLSLKNILLNNNISSSRIRKRYDNNISCMMDIRGSVNIDKIYDCFYLNNDFYLNRKKNKFEDFKKSIEKSKKRKYKQDFIEVVTDLYNKGIEQCNIAINLNIPKSSVRGIIQRARKRGEII